MGVLGLWQLLSPVGQPVTLESLENKIFAVDISIWLNQAVKGYRDSQGGSVPNAHLLSLFSRLCKLLFYKIRPIIVFDGGFPELKKQTIINRQQRRAAIKQSSKDVGLKILTNYIASQQLGKTVNTSEFKKSIRVKEKPRDEIFKLPPLPESSQSFLSDSCESNDDFEKKFTNFSKEDIKYLNQIDIESDDFNALPPDVKQEILSSLKESRRHCSWEQFNELPKESTEFSSYQMQCLLKKRKLQSKLEEVQRDIREINSSAYVSQYTSDHVIGETNKIMSDDTSYYVLLKKIMKQNENDFNEESSEDVKPSTSVMADTKNAFIRDIENIDLMDDCFSSDDNLDIKIGDNQVAKKMKIEINSSDLGNKKFDNNTSNKKINQVGMEVNSLDLSDEEFDVDNPPLVDSIIHLSKRNSDEAFESNNTQTSNRDSSDDSNTGQGMCLSDNLSKAFNLEMQVMPKKHNELTTNNQIELLSTEDEITSRKMTQKVTSAGMNDLVHSHMTSSTYTNSNLKDQDAVKANAAENKDESLLPTESGPIRKSEDESDFKNQSLKENNMPSTSRDQISVSSDNEYLLSSNTDENVHEANVELQKDLDTAAAILEAEQAKQDRQSNTVQDHMIEECKELLQLFGIPYVVSPLEAEAQCAFYDMVDFTHGTITDDSDVWLFGGKRVFKNFFTQQKFVECYKDKEIFVHFGVSRKMLINFALLTGSDYTEGIEGVGPVTAMEIISEFPGEGIDALQKFKSWWLDSNKSARPPENKVRAKLQKLILAQNFPDEKVFEAYLHPEVDDSMEKFTWGRPDLDALRDYAKERFGWNQSKLDSALLPVLKKLNERDKQTHLDSFFTVTLKKETNLFPSKRIMSALKKITSPQKQENENSIPTNAQKYKSKKSGKKPITKRFQNAASVRGRGKKISQGPALSEESSSDSNM